MERAQNLDKKQKFLLWAVILSAGSHVFCCVLPTFFSAIALLSGFGILATIPGWAEQFHDVMHDWEVPALIFSGAVVAIGWAAHYYSIKNDCHSHGCEHGSCQPTKRRASKILLFASALFIINCAVFFGFHQEEIPSAHAEHDHAHHEHAHHDAD